MNTLSAVIMAHPKREKYIEPLMEALGEDLHIVWDGGWNDRHVTGIKAMQAYDRSATHHLVLQEDIIPSVDLIASVEKLIQHSGNHPVALYCGKTSPRHSALQQLIADARAQHIPWWSYEGPWWGPGIVVPTEHIDQMAAWYKHPSNKNISGYDRRISRWYGMKGIECWYTAPSLVDHMTIEEHGNESLVYNRTGKFRGAFWFIGADQSALNTDWSVLPIDYQAIGSRCLHGKLNFERCPHCGRWR